jgi:hypothetical protein
MNASHNRHVLHSKTLCSSVNRHLLYNYETWNSAIQNEHALADAAYNKLEYYVASFSYNTHLYVTKTLFA